MTTGMKKSLARQCAVGLACLAGLTGCHWDMWNDARMKPMELGAFFPNGVTALPYVEGTVQYKRPRTDDHLYTGKVNGELVDALPAGLELDRALLERGQERFNIYCAPCHGLQGDGNGMVVKRGFPTPPSYHIDRLREAPLGYTVDVITNGFGRMYSYASRVAPEDRWAIAAYVKALQLSQNATPDLLPADVRALAENPQPAQPDEHHDEH